MSTATQQPQTVLDYIRTVDGADPKTALELAIAEAQRSQAEAQKQVLEARSLAEVTFDAKGLRASNMAGLWRMATIYAKSDLVPEHYRRKPEDCFIAIQMAQRMGIDALAYMQASYIVHGLPGIEAKLAIAVANASGVFAERIKWRFEGQGASRKCTAYTHDAQTGDLLEQSVTWAMAEQEGWTRDKPLRSGGTQKSKWNTMPDIMFQYRAAMFLIRLYAPEVLMGVKTVDELADELPPEPADRVTIKAPSNLDDLAARLEHRGNGTTPTPAQAPPEPASEAQESGHSAAAGKMVPPFDPPQPQEAAEASDPVADEAAEMEMAARAGEYSDLIRDTDAEGLTLYAKAIADDVLAGKLTKSYAYQLTQSIEDRRKKLSPPKRGRPPKDRLFEAGQSATEGGM